MEQDELERRKQRNFAAFEAMCKKDEKQARIAEFKIGIAVARFNETITRSLLDGARAALIHQGVKEENIAVVWVPGAFELPLAAQFFAEGRRGVFDAVVTLGAVIRGGTPHFDYVCKAATDGVMQVGLKCGIPVIFGVLTCDTPEQAWERAGAIDVGESSIAAASHDSEVAPQHRNKGCEAAEAAVEMALIAGERG